MIIDQETMSHLMETMSAIELKGKSKSDYSIEGKRVPRVTEVLSSMIHEDGLMRWANSLGFKRISYQAFMRDAADKGTYVHNAIEYYLKHGNLDEFEFPRSEKVKDCIYSCLDGFDQWWFGMNEKYNNVEIVFIEETLIHPYFGGTCDCLLKVDDKYWLIDFKTSNHMSYNYVLQLSAYKYLLKELKGIDISMAMVLRLDKFEHEFEEFMINLETDDGLNFINECLETFMILVAAYKMRMNNKSSYNNFGF